jgi:hypothetical protein
VGPGSSGRRDPDGDLAAPPEEALKPRRPGHSIPLIDHAIEGEDSTSAIVQRLDGQIHCCLQAKLMGAGKKSASEKVKKIRRANEQCAAEGPIRLRREASTTTNKAKGRVSAPSSRLHTYFFPFLLDVESQREETFFLVP